MNYRKQTLAALLLVSSLTDISLANEHEHRQHREANARTGWHGEIDRFHEHDMNRWRGGRWHNGYHEGRNGWWWIVGGVWYFYPTRLKSYPDPYQPPMVAAPPPTAQARYWYYCANPAGYYPYVAQCVTGWQRIQATTPPLAPLR